MAHVERSENILQESALSFYHESLGDRTRVFKFGRSHLYTASSAGLVYEFTFQGTSCVPLLAHQTHFPDFI